MKIKFVLNGEPMEREVEGGRRLLDFLREDLHLTELRKGAGRANAAPVP